MPTTQSRLDDVVELHVVRNLLGRVQVGEQARQIFSEHRHLLLFDLDGEAYSAARALKQKDRAFRRRRPHLR